MGKWRRRARQLLPGRLPWQEACEASGDQARPRARLAS